MSTKQDALGEQYDTGYREGISSQSASWEMVLDDILGEGTDIGNVVERIKTYGDRREAEVLNRLPRKPAQEMRISQGTFVEGWNAYMAEVERLAQLTTKREETQG